MIAQLARIVGLTMVPAPLAWAEPAGEDAPRLDYEASIKRLRDFGYLGKREAPPLLAKPPSAYDTILGLSFFRTRIHEADMSNLTLPRTFFGRSEIAKVQFRNADLTQSTMCWNDFIDVSFARATLTRCDMRGSVFVSVDFRSADLRFADLRHSSFETCDFADAAMTAAILTREQGTGLDLSERQKAVIAWTDDPGPEPKGG